MRFKNGRLVMFYPPVVYDVLQFLMFPVNYVICVLCHLQPQKSEWNEAGYPEQKLDGSGASLNEIHNNILNEVDMAHNEQDLVRLYDSLPVIRAEQLTNRTWNGRILRTNRSVLDLAEWFVIRPLRLIGIRWGKRYRSAHKGDPLLFRWFDRFYFPIPVWGNVGMTDIRWRGEATATMNYDHQPWKDYFRVLEDKDGKVILLGVWTHKRIAGGWFTLTLDETTPAQMIGDGDQ